MRFENATAATDRIVTEEFDMVGMDLSGKEIGLAGAGNSKRHGENEGFYGRGSALVLLRRFTTAAAAMALTVAALLAGTLAMPASAFAGKLEVVATVPSLAAVAREIGGDSVSVTSLSLPSQDPHFVDARPSLALSLNRADVLLLVGLELEQGWLPTLLTGARNPKIQPGAPGYVDCSSAVELLGVPQGPVDRRMGDVHAGGNPHYMFAPRNALAVAALVAERLSQADPGRSEAYSANLNRFTQDLSRRIVEWEAEMASFKGRAVISYHSSWMYLTSWLGLREVAFIESKPGIAPTPAHVSQVIVIGRREKADVILQETFYPDGTTRLVAGKLPARLLKLSGGPDFREGESYGDSIGKMLKTIKDGLWKAAQGEGADGKGASK